MYVSCFSPYMLYVFCYVFFCISLFCFIFFCVLTCLSVFAPCFFVDVLFLNILSWYSSSLFLNMVLWFLMLGFVFVPFFAHSVSCITNSVRETSHQIVRFWWVVAPHAHARQWVEAVLVSRLSTSRASRLFLSFASRNVSGNQGPRQRGIAWQIGSQNYGVRARSVTARHLFWMNFL